MIAVAGMNMAKANAQPIRLGVFTEAGSFGARAYRNSVYIVSIGPDGKVESLLGRVLVNKFAVAEAQIAKKAILECEVGSQKYPYAKVEAKEAGTALAWIKDTEKQKEAVRISRDFGKAAQ